jgi:hypothetical protein
MNCPDDSRNAPFDRTIGPRPSHGERVGDDRVAAEGCPHSENVAPHEKNRSFK